jgi:hypothetical protein
VLWWAVARDSSGHASSSHGPSDPKVADTLGDAEEMDELGDG